MKLPLAERMRPKELSDYLNQEHLIGENGIIQKMIENDVLASMIFWGSPGIGKTSLAELIALKSKREFYQLSAINSGVKEVREIIEKAKNTTLFSNTSPIVFIDEIHRFSKSQQDSLLQAVEKGYIVLIGATTENPSFEVISALLSRCQVYVLNPFSKESLEQLLKNAIQKDEVLQTKNINLKESDALLYFSGGDARKLLNNLEIVIETINQDEIVITNKITEKILHNSFAKYDKKGENHYDVISAFIKSVRGSSADASVYYLAQMLDAGEDIKFIARRLIILASEDIGLANPTALVIANNCFQAVQTIGMPEARIVLSQCTIYLATSPKSNSAYIAIDKALQYVRQNPNLEVPLHLRNAPTKLMKQLNYGKDYKYAHNYQGNFVKQNYLPEKVKDEVFYIPSDNAKEKSIQEYLNKIQNQ
ncbi:MAG: replication-associated recombination protein A [Flavobacteriales bacterium]|nr:replication-associated recombination protein A [Flavobacteriales bacterium]